VAVVVELEVAAGDAVALLAVELRVEPPHPAAPSASTAPSATETRNQCL
jgi:hypothetical protein